MASEAGFHEARFLAEIDYKDGVFMPIFSDHKEPISATPTYIILEGNNLRWSKNEDESFAIMKKIH